MKNFYTIRNMADGYQARHTDFILKIFTLLPSAEEYKLEDFMYIPVDDDDRIFYILAKNYKMVVGNNQTPFVLNKNFFFSYNNTTLFEIRKNVYYGKVALLRSDKIIYENFLIFLKDSPDELMENVIMEIYEKYKTLDAEMESVPSKKNIERVILPDELKSNIINDMQNFLRSKHIYQEIGIPWKRGYIFAGPPGNGKTLTIRTLASYLNLNIEDMKSYIRDGNLNLPIEYEEPKADVTEFLYKLSFGRMLNEEEKAEKQPTIYYLEDMEKIIAGQSGEDAAVATLSSILNSIDGVESVENGSIFIGTTNNLETLAQSLVGRPGRFDKVYMFEPPQLQQIIEFFDFHGFVIENEKTTKEIAKQLKGVSMAFVEEFMKSSRMEALDNNVSLKIANRNLEEIKKHNKLYKKALEGVGFH